MTQTLDSPQSAERELISRNDKAFERALALVADRRGNSRRSGMCRGT
ncbi:hypothetical protein SAZ11_41010 [Streptomyces sp. FXJ1.4098]|nr:hypothetical protein [Streptomyces sp. FXJ1.4098]